MDIEQIREKFRQGQFSCEDELQIVTTYIPDDREWIAYRKRRR